MSINDNILKNENGENDDYTEFSDDNILYNNQDESGEVYKSYIKNAKFASYEKSRKFKNINNQNRAKNREN